MKKRSLWKRIKYWFDCIMSKGPIAMSLLLFVVTALVVAASGVFASFVSDDGGVLYQLWSSLMYTLDAGNLAGVPTDNVFYLLLMFLATLCGLFLTSILIGIISASIEDRLSNLRKGTSVVQEEDHTVIIGFDNNIFTILRELIEANSNKKKACIVVLDEKPKEEMESAISSHISNTQTTRIICRSGGIHETYALERCSIETSKSVIINIYNDVETIKVLLALSNYIKGKKLKNTGLRFVTCIQDKQYLEAANIAGDGHASVVFAKDAIARIISNTCRQHGLSGVLTELFNFSGNELYFENVPKLKGKAFKDAILSFSNAIVVGICVDGSVTLNPPMNTIIGADDQLVLLELDDGDFKYQDAKKGDETKIQSGNCVCATSSNTLVVLGSNDKLPIILEEYSKYVQLGTRVVIVDDDFDISTLKNCNNIEISVCSQKVTRDLLCEILDENANNILLLNDDSLAPEASDSQTLLRLILLRDIADHSELHFSITTEMRSAENQRLATQARVDDFVIGSNFASLIMTQISENPNLMPLIKELLDEDGSELYMKPIADYVTTGAQVDSYTIAESAARKGEIYVGYRHIGEILENVVVNPNKDELVVFGERDQIVVIAEK